MATVNYNGIDEATLIHALYNGSQPLGMGMLQHIDGLTVEDVQKELQSRYKRPGGGIPHLDHPNEEADGLISFDYYHGHPFKLKLDTQAKTFESRGFDRDSGEGRAQAIVDGLKK